MPHLIGNALNNLGLLAEKPRGGAYGTTMPTVVAAAFILGVSTFFVNKMLGRMKPNEEAVKRRETEESIKRFAAISVVGAGYNAVVGVGAALLAIDVTMSYGRSDEYMYYFDREKGYGEVPQRVFYTAVLLAELFYGYTVHMTIMWIMGWDKGIDTILHHIGFLLVCFYMVPKGAYPQLGLFAIAMEISTPPLLYYLTMRQVNPPAPFVDLSGLIFSVLFILFRVVGYSYAYLASVFSLYNRPGLTPPQLTPFENGLILSLLGLGLVLQLFWSKTIFGKLFGLVKPTKK